MKKLFFTVTIFLAFLLILSCGGSPTTTAIPEPPSPEELDAQGFLLPELPRITCEQLKQKIDNGEPLVVVDTRLEFFFNMAHIPESIVIPFQLIDEQTTSFLSLPKDRPIVFYCD
jgi:hypothetical protein